MALRKEQLDVTRERPEAQSAQLSQCSKDGVVRPSPLSNTPIIVGAISVLGVAGMAAWKIYQNVRKEAR